MKPYLVDVPVRVMIWTRPECLKKQFKVLQQARPSTLFLVSDGGRNESEWALIQQSRQIMDGIDWECTIHKLYMDKNQGMYGMMRPQMDMIWTTVDRCIFLEDDFVPAVSYFRYCAELLEKYENDLRIHMICGYNPIGIYEEASKHQDYFFTETGWAIWGCAYWRRSVEGHRYPLPYQENNYITKQLRNNLTRFWWEKAEGYLKGNMVDGHVPGDEFFFAMKSTLQHQVNIVPSRNMISNIGVNGTHVDAEMMTPKDKVLFNSPVYELEFPLRHPDYIIDDKIYGKLYADALSLHRLTFFRKIPLWLRSKWVYFKRGKLIESFHKKPHIER